MAKHELKIEGESLDTDKILEEERKSEDRIAEVKGSFVKVGSAVMRYGVKTKGEKPKDGYALFIALHGGGQSDTPRLNDSQWEIMKDYYFGSVTNGIYVCPRGIRDTWNTHFCEESYALYKRLIENMIIFYGADPNRVYLLGYSAGGDGVYQIAPRMADFFAAANMSAGHPNGVSLKNLKNVPFYIQCGENDCAYKRNEETVRYAKDENVTEAFIHRGKGHQIVDNGGVMQEMADREMKDSNAVRLLEKHVRDCYPEEILWELRYKTENYFYYIGSEAKTGLIRARRRGNIFIIEGEADRLYLNEKFADFSEPVTVLYNGKEMRFSVGASKEVRKRTFMRRFDKNMTFSCEINLKNGGINL